MQDGTPELEAALAKTTVVWKPDAQIDWALDGFDGVDTIDDVNSQTGQFSINHGMDDGLPDEISLLRADPIPKFKANAYGRGERTAAQYFSPFRTDSPIYGYERDLAPVTFDQGVVTSSGIEQTRLFTGRLQDTPVVGGKASIEAVSDTRLKLSQLVQPPVHSNVEVQNFARYGLTALWPVSWVLHECGVYPSPPPQPNTKYYLSFHGGAHTTYPSTNPLTNMSTSGGFEGLYFDVATNAADPLAGAFARDNQWIAGPYGAALYAGFNSTRSQGASSIGIVMASGLPGWWTQTENTGRFEFWIRGDDISAINTVPGGSGSVFFNLTHLSGGIALLLGTGSEDSATATKGLQFGVDIQRRLFVQLYDGTMHTQTGPTIPGDSDWHACGVAWSGSANKVWFYLDGAVTTSTPSPSIVTASLAADGTAFNFQSVAWLPTAEWHFSTGAPANPDSGNPWVEEQDWTRGAHLYPSALRLACLAEKQPIEAWQIISEYARAELAALTIDESDLFHYRPRGYFATLAGQTVSQTLDTFDDAALPDVQLDHTRIRTVARVTYESTYTDYQPVFLLQFSNVITFSPGTTTLIFTLDQQASLVQSGLLATGPLTYTNSSVAFLTATDVAATDLDIVGQTGYVAIMDAARTIYATNTEFAVTVTEWTSTSVTIQFVNLTASTWYLQSTSTANKPYLAIKGHGVRSSQAAVIEQYDAGVALRGQIGLTVNLSRIQQESDARRMARRLVVPHSFPIPVIGSVELFGDPRRQPGDLVEFTDQVETGAAGLWRVHQLVHASDGSSYTQTAIAQQARLTGQWGDGVSKWGRCVWKGQEA